MIQVSLDFVWRYFDPLPIIIIIKLFHPGPDSVYAFDFGGDGGGEGEISAGRVIVHRLLISVLHTN